MASGTIELTRNATGVYLNGRILWESTSNGTAANTSTVTATLYLQRNALNTTTGTFTGTFTVGGNSQSISWYGSLPSKEWISIATITTTVNHSANGVGNCYIYAYIHGPGGTTMSDTYVSGSATVTLDTIARYAEIKSVTSFTDEGNPVITYSNPAGTAVSSLQASISLNGVGATTALKDVPMTGTSFTFPLTEDERNTLRAATPNSNTLQVYVLLRTIIGSASEVKTATTTMKIVNANPTLSPTISDTNNTTYNLTGNRSILVALHSTAQVTINATAQKYATIKSQRVDHGTATLTGNGTLSVTNNPIKITVTDSRDNSTLYTATNTIVPYIKPTCVIGNNAPGTNGTYRLEASGVYYNGSIGKTANTLTVSYRYKTSGGNYGGWTDISSVTKTGNSYTAVANLTGLDYQTAYVFQVRAVDKLNTITSAERVTKSTPVFDWGESDFRFNVPVNLSEGCDILRNGSLAYVPVGYGFGDPVDKSSYKVMATWGESYAAYCAKVDAALATMENYTTRLVWARGVTTETDPYSQTGNTLAVLYRGESAGSAQLIPLAAEGSKPMWKMSKSGGTWKELEWVNPPMLPGKEYCTTEWHNGYSVYTKIVNFGACPNNNYTVIDLGLGGAWSAVRHSAYVRDSSTHVSLPYDGGEGNKIWTYTTSGKFVLYTNFDASNYTSGRVQVWYIKAQ